MENESLWIRAPEKSPVKLISNRLIPEYIRENIDLHLWGWGELIAFESAETGRKLTHNQVLEGSRAFAAGLIKLGSELNLKRGDVIAVILPNVLEYASVVFGIWEAGFVVTPVNPSSIEDEMSRQLEFTRSKIIITISQHLPMARFIQQKNPLIRKIIIVETNSDSLESNENCLSYSQMLKTNTEGIQFFTGSLLTEENDVAMIPFSSGTSGLPKGVMITHFALLASVQMSTANLSFPTKNFHVKGGQERAIAILPFFHCFGFITVLSASMFQGAHVLTMSGFNPTLFINKLPEFKPTVLYLVPTLINFIVNSNKIGSKELEELLCIASGAAPAGEVLIQKLLEKAKNATFIEGYGLTELTCIASTCRRQKIGSIGQPLPETVAKIVDILETGNGRTLGKGERGELCIKSPSVMKGYFENEKATKDCIDENGWFHTGNIAYYDEDGFLFIVDRLKELIKVKGCQVAPSELEDVIRNHEKVEDVAVIGIPDEICGEVPRAFVVLKAGENLTLNDYEIEEFVAKRVSSHKRLRGGVQFVKEIPKGGSGKILRRILKDSYFKNTIN